MEHSCREVRWPLESEKVTRERWRNLSRERSSRDSGRCGSKITSWNRNFQDGKKGLLVSVLDVC